MHLVDIAAAMAASRIRQFTCHRSVDYIDFRNPINIGDCILKRRSIASSHSMGSGVKFFLKMRDRRTKTHHHGVCDIRRNRCPDKTAKTVAPLILKKSKKNAAGREAGLRRKTRLALRYKKTPRKGLSLPSGIFTFLIRVSIFLPPRPPKSAWS